MGVGRYLVHSVRFTRSLLLHRCWILWIFLNVFVADQHYTLCIQVFSLCVCDVVGRVVSVSEAPSSEVTQHQPLVVEWSNVITISNCSY